MPPIPSPGEAASGGTKGRRPSTAKGTRERGAAAGSSSARSSAAPQSRQSRYDALQDKLTRMYMMLGTMVRPFGRFYPVAEPIGDNLKTFSAEASEAWIELAKEDSRVLETLENLTKASTWGNVIGIHFAIFASSIPGAAGSYVNQVTDVPQGAPMDPEAYAQSLGLTPEEYAAAQAMAAQMMGQPEMPVRDQSSGGPGDTARAAPAPEYTPAGDGGTATAAPPPIQSTAPRSKAAIVTPAELGVVQPGEMSAFPQGGPPNGTAGQM